MSKSVSTFVCILGLVHIKGFMCQLTPAVSEHDYCLGEMVTFTCTQRIGRIDGRTHDSLSWAIGTSQLTFVAGLDPPGDSELLQPFAQNQMIGFEAIVDSVTPNTLLQSSLRVMMPMELNGLSIRCEGESVYQTAAINVTSSVPLSPQSILATDIQNNSDSSIVTLRWDVPVGAAVDNYSVAIDPVPSSGAPPTATSTQSTVTVLYNINYAISITAVNCIGSGATASTRITLVNCFSPMAASGVVVEPHSATTQGAVINYFCQQSPSERLMSVCGDDGRWNPDLQVHICVTSTPPTPVACSRPPPPANGSVGEIVRIGEGYEVTFQCDDGLFPTGQFIARCVSDGMWSPDPAEVECSAEFFNCSSPPPPTNGFIGNVTSVSVMFGCNEGFTPRTSMTAVCVGVNMWKPDPSEFLCSPEKSQANVNAAVPVAITVVLFVTLASVLVVTICVVIRVKKKGSKDADNSHRFGLELQDTNETRTEYCTTKHPGPRGNQSVTVNTNTLVYAGLDLPSEKKLSSHADHADNPTSYADINFAATDKLNKVPHGESADDLLNLDSLLIQLKPEVTSKWELFARVVGLSQEVIKDLSNCGPDERMVEMLDYWLRNHPNKPTWREVAQILEELHLYQLADDLLKVYETGELPVPFDMNEVPEGTLPRFEPPPPLPPKLPDLDDGPEPPPLVCDLPPKPPPHGGLPVHAPPPLPPPYHENGGSILPPRRPPKSHSHGMPRRPPEAGTAVPALPPKPKT